ncbi:MAG: PAS domain S-box protein [Candidatus Geothermincolia bacterium]
MDETFFSGSLEDLRQGMHVAFVYESENERKNVVSQLVLHGLAHNCKVVYVPNDEAEASRVRAFLHDAGVGLERELENGGLELLDYGHFFQEAGVFDAGAIPANLESQSKRALAEGYSTVLITGDNTWQASDDSQLQPLLDYHSYLNTRAGASYVLICQFGLATSDPSALISAMLVHPYLMRGTHLFRNIFFGRALRARPDAGPADVSEFLDEAAREADYERHCGFLKPQHGAGVVREQGLIDTIPEHLYVIDREGRILYVSKTALGALGLTEDQVLGQHWRVLSDFEEVELKVEELRRRVFEGGEVIRDEVSVDLPRGHYEFEYTLSPLPGPAGEVIAAMATVRDVTVHRRAEQGLRRDRDFVSAVLDTVRGFVTVTDEDDHIVLFNEALQKTSGYSFSEAQGRVLSDFLVAPDDREMVAGKIAALREAGVPATYEARLLTRSGEERVVNWVSSMLARQDEAGRFVVSIGTDVTDLKKLQEELLESEQRFRMAAAASASIIFEFDAQTGRLRWFGDSRKIGVTPEELPASMALFSLAHSEDAETLRRAMRVAFLEKKPLRTDTRIVNADGDVHHWLIEAEVLRGATGVAERWVGSIRDVTQNRRYLESLRRTETRFRSLFESAPVGILIHRHGSVMMVNKALLDIYGYDDVSQVVGTSVLDYIIPEQREQVMDNVRRRESGEEIPTAYEVTGLRRDGALVPLFLAATMIQLEDGPALMIYLLDMTERKRDEEALRRSSEQLRNFLSIAAHELRHPITILKGYAQLLAEYGEEALVRKETPEILAHIQSSGDRLAALVEELLDVSRIETGRMEVDKESLDVSELLQEAVAEICERRCVNPITVHVAADATSLEADPVKLSRAVLFLLQNAINFSPESSPIELIVTRADGFSRIAVCDRGIGIPEESRENVFERFFQLEDPMHHSVPGLGMGLYIAREIATAHGGRIWNEPRAEGGTKFVLELP